jgi:DNA-binding response OmpR family regulator
MSFHTAPLYSMTSPAPLRSGVCIAAGRPEDADLLRALLDREGYGTDVVTGFGVLDALMRQAVPEALILDDSMGAAHVSQAVRLLRASGAWDDVHEAELFGLGVDDVIHKPLRVTALMARMRHRIGGYRSAPALQS